MHLLDRLAASLGYSKTASLDNPPAWLGATAHAERYSLPDEALAQGHAALYERLSWVQIAISRVAEAAAVAAFQVQALDDEESTAVVNHPFELLLRRPNPLMSRFELLVSTFSWLNVSGNSYWWLNRKNANQPPSEIWQLPSRQIEPIPDGRMYLKGYLYSPGESKDNLILEPWEVVHFRRWHPNNWFVGLSPLSALETVSRGDLAMQRWNTNIFAENNAKVPGALAFKDHVDDVRWQQMKQDVIAQHGGTRRNLMMLRGVGDGVNWLQMAMSPADMEFLSGRNANKEEIWAAIAPGLSSMLAVNATEANAIAGRGSFVELAVWPQMVAIAEKITNDLLPAYGPNLVGQFDDIRPVDRNLVLQEQAAYASVHTVDEVRAKFYSSEPLGDERGLLLGPEVGKGSIGPPSEEAALAGDFQVLPPPPTPLQLEDTQSTPQDEDSESAKRREAKALKRYLKNRPQAQIDAFERRYLTPDEVSGIAAQVRGTALPGMPPFPTTRKALLLLDPDDDEAESKVRRKLEKQSTSEIAKALQDILDELIAKGETFEFAPQELAKEFNGVMKEMKQARKLRDPVERMLVDGVDLGVSVASEGLAQTGFSMDWSLVNTAAREWARAHAGDVVDQMDESTRAVLKESISRWIDSGEPMQALIDDITPAFGEERAEKVAVTEVTRSFSAANQMTWEESGQVISQEWVTVLDERVCSLCGPMHEERREFDEPFGEDVFGEAMYFPPAHPSCRCFLRPVVAGR